MLAYAASAPRTAERSPSPNAMLAIVAAHVALVALVMSAKLDIPIHINGKPIEVTWIDPVEPPPPNPPVQRTPHPQPGPTALEPEVPVPPSPGPTLTPTPPLPNPGPFVSPSGDLLPLPTPTPAPVRIAAQLLTPSSELRPPYPPSKLAAEEEASLRLSLSIDERGRVVAVEPVGRADPVFLAAARRYMLAHWRYKPASEGGRAVASTIVITLKFQLDG
jgi:protein TonB